ncbi:MAG: GerW family sporulation protein [Oscillospiraceae bacterium]|nr:GerW family sporulation protein [Oscillospiraceae bacterium]
MENTNIGNLMETTMNKMKEIVNVDTVVGTPIQTPDGVMIIPVSRVSYAFASGGSDFRVKDNSNLGFGGGNGAGVKVEPIGFLVVREGSVRMMNVTPPANATVDRLIEKAPELIDTVEDLIRKFTKKDGE